MSEGDYKDMLTNFLLSQHVYESIGALKATDKTGGKCEMCSRRKKTLLPKPYSVSEGGPIKTARVCKSCNIMIDAVLGSKPDGGYGSPEQSELLYGRMKTLLRVKMLYHGVLHNHPPVVIVSVLRSMLGWMSKDPEYRELVQGIMEEKTNEDYGDDEA